MVVGKVVSLEGGGGIGAEGDAVLAGGVGVQVFECVDRSIVVLLIGSVLVRF